MKNVYGISSSNSKNTDIHLDVVEENAYEEMLMNKLEIHKIDPGKSAMGIRLIISNIVMYAQYKNPQQILTKKFQWTRNPRK